MQPDAELRLPAESAYVAVLRMATAAIAARLDFTLDDIEDLRMAVGEACAMVLDDASPGGTLMAQYFLTPERIEVRVSADASTPAQPDPSSFAWQVLTTTADDVRSETADGRLIVSLSVTSTTSSASA